MGDDAAKAIVQELLRSVNKPAQGRRSRRSSASCCCWSARPRCSASCRTRSTASGARRRASARRPVELLRARLLSFGMILGIAFLLMVSLVLSAAISALGKWWGGLFGGWETLRRW